MHAAFKYKYEYNLIKVNSHNCSKAFLKASWKKNITKWSDTPYEKVKDKEDDDDEDKKMHFWVRLPI